MAFRKSFKRRSSRKLVPKSIYRRLPRAAKKALARVSRKRRY